MVLGMLVAVGFAFGQMDGPEIAQGDGDHFGDHHGGFGGHDHYYDWLSPGGYYSYSYWYPTYYTYPTYSYPVYTYTYPTYYYTTPVVYPTYTYYYDPVVYDPWYATNVYGWSGATYYYTSGWSWSNHGGFYL